MLLPSRETFELTDFRLAGREDIDGLIDLYQLFFADSDLPELGLAFNPDRVRPWLERVIGNGSSPHLIAVEKETGLIVGSLNYTLDHTTDKPFANLDKFYVRRNWRLSAIGRMLLQLAMDVAKDDGAVAFRAGISSGIGYGKNLFLHFKFRETAGSVLLARRL
jgi:GNAT superfamily N-acetyltransferase